MSKIKTKYIEPNAVTNPILAQMPASTLKGNNTGGSANAQDLTVSQVQSLLGVTAVAATNVFAINDSNFENNSINNWIRYLDAAQAEPVDGTGGSPSANFTFAPTASNPLAGTYSGLLTKSGSTNLQGYGLSNDVLPMPIEFRGQDLDFSVYYTIASGTYTPGDVVIRLYDTTNGALLASSTEILAYTATGVSSKFKCQFKCPLTCANVRVIIHQSSVTTNNYTIAFDDFSLWSSATYGAAAKQSVSWTGYHDQSVSNWIFDNTSSFADPSSNSNNGNDLVETDNNGLGTVTGYKSGARNLPGIVFTPPQLGRYRFKATISVINPPAASHFGVFQLTDGTTVIDEGTAIGSQGGELILSGILNVTSLSAKTIKIQCKVSTPSAVISTTGLGQSMIMWAVDNLPGASIGAGSSASSAIYQYNDMAGHASSATKIPYWTNVIRASDSSNLGTVVNSSVNGFSFTANRRCLVSMIWNVTYNAGDYTGISKNSPFLTTGISQTNNVPYKITYQYTNANNYSHTTSVSVMLEAGDVLRPHDEGGATNSNSLNHMRVEAVEVAMPASGTLQALGTALFTFGNASGLSSSNTAIPYFTSVVNAIDPNNILSVVNSSTFGLSVTALKDCSISMNFPMGYNGSDYKGISKNSTQLSTTIDSVNQPDRMYQTFSVTNAIAHVGATVPMKAGDVLRPHLSPGYSINSYGMFITAVQTNVMVNAIGQGNSSQSVDNLGLVASVAGSALTIDMKDKSGAAPSADSQITIGMRSPTLSSGLFNTRTVTSANSITIPSGATLGLESGSNGYIYAYALDYLGNVEMAISSMWMDDSVLATTTAISSSADDNGLYSTTARSNVPFRLIGRFRYSTNPNGTYSAIPDECSLLSSDLFPSVCLSNSGSYHTAPANNTYQASSGNSLTLQPGFYRVDATLDVEPIANSLTYIQDRTSYWCLANGADNTSAPALVTTSPKLVFNNYDPNNYEAPEWNSMNGNYNFWHTSVKPMFVEVKKTCTIYIVQYLASSNTTNLQTKQFVQAVQLKKVP